MIHTLSPELVRGADFDGYLGIPLIKKPDKLIIPSDIVPFTKRNRLEGADVAIGFYEILIGGKDPQVQMARIVHIQGGKIASYDNQSGHYKPNIKSMGVADEAFGKFPSILFKKKKGR